MLTESEMIKQARLTGMDEELVSYAFVTLGSGGRGTSFE